MSRLIFSIFIILFVSCHPKKETNKYYPNGALRSKYYLIDEKIEGEMLDYSQNGKLVSKKMFSNGIQDGKTEYYYESGKLMEVQYYTKGERYLSELGYAILIDGKVEYLIGIYEPHGASLNAKRGLITAHGHEEIIKLWLDDGEFEETHTR